MDAPTLWVASGALVLAAVIFLGDKLGGPQLHPYTGSYQVLLFNLFTAVAICESTRLVAERWRLWLEPLTEVGGMWLTMYVAMTLSTAAYLQLSPPGTRDDSWVVLACLVVGALVFAVTWVRLLGNTRFREGPIEGLLRPPRRPRPAHRTRGRRRTRHGRRLQLPQPHVAHRVVAVLAQHERRA